MEEGCRENQWLQRRKNAEHAMRVDSWSRSQCKTNHEPEIVKHSVKV